MSFDVVVCAGIARRLHHGMVDRAGVDYFDGHLEAVAAPFADDDIAKCVAYLHDSIEDCGISASDLLGMLVDGGIDAGIAADIVGVVVVMSHSESDSYDEYLVRVRSNSIARRVKLSDLSHNMDLSRLRVLRPNDLVRNEKYDAARKFLES